jgi:hypothetical protein
VIQSLGNNNAHIKGKITTNIDKRIVKLISIAGKVKRNNFTRNICSAANQSSVTDEARRNGTLDFRGRQ